MDSPEIDDVIQRLESTPARLISAIAGRRAAALRRRPAPGEWSAHDLIGHLRASDDILAPRLLMVLTRDGVLLTSLDERSWAEVAGYHAMDARGLLRTFAHRRRELVAALRRASPADWERRGLHDVHGAMDLLAIARSLADHEDEHCRQLEAMMRVATAAP